MIKKMLFIFCLTALQYAYSQDQKNAVIFGVVKDINEKGITNTHIYNATSKQGTITDKKGAFHLIVKKGDWLQITNVQYKTKRFRVTNTIVKEKTIQIYLFGITNQLEEVIIEKKMKGFLSLDRIAKKKDTIPKVDKEYYNFSTMDLSFKGVKNLQDKGNAQYHTDPTMKNVAVTIISIGIPDNSSKMRKASRKRHNFKQNFPHLVIKKLSKKFFLTTLKIPNDRIFHFIDYCIQFGIEALYKNNKELDLLKIMLKESKSYLQQIENQK